MSKHLEISALKVGNAIAIWNDSENDFQLTKVKTVSSDGCYITTEKYPDLAFDRQSGESTQDNYRELYYPLEAQDRKKRKQKEIAEMLAEVQRKSESDARKAKLIAFINDDAVSIDSDDHLEKCFDIFGF